MQSKVQPDRSDLNTGSVVKLADKSTFIKLDRNIINWRWYGNPKVLSVFIWLIVKANIRKGNFEKDVIERGSLVTSNAHIAEGCNLTFQNVRTALANLEETGEIKRIQRNHYQIITIVNYESYQSDSRNSIGQLTSNSQATNKQLTTIKEYKNGKNGKNKRKPSPLAGGNDVPRASRLKPIDEGTYDDIPEEYRDFCHTYEEFWKFCNR